MTTGNNTLQDIEREMIQNDTLFYLRLYQHLYSTARTDLGVLILSIIPYLALFVVESFNYFQKIDPNYAQKLQRNHKDILDNARNQIKLFDEKYRQVIGMIDFMDEITKAHYKRFFLTIPACLQV